MAQAGRRNLLLVLLILILVIIAGWLWWPRAESGGAVDLAPASTPAAQALSEEVQTDVPADSATSAESDSDAATAATDASVAVEGNDATPESSPAEQTGAEPASAASGTRHFVLDPAQSEARFIIDEVLFGNPNTVVGSTDVVSGAITVDLGDLGQTTVDPIVVDASELATDNRFRNRSLRRLILQSNRDEYQYITFTPTAIAGLPAAPVVGETANLEITGDLQIRDSVQPATFAVTITATSETQLEGLAVATVQRAVFDLQIPEVDGVAEVSEDVRLEFEFVAVAEE